MDAVPRPSRLLTDLAPRGLPGVRTLLRIGLGAVFGPPPFDPSADRGDPGLFGPGSVSWRVVAEPASIVGGVRALLVQLLHPLAVAGVADHSRYREDPLGRLHGTSAYVTATTFGSTREAEAAAEAVRRAHRRVAGTAPDGRPYRADDPHLLLWVSVALTSSFLATDRAYAPRPVTGTDADRFVAEQAHAASLLDPTGALEALLPRTAADLEATLGAFRPELEVGAQGREILRFLRRPRLQPPVLVGYLGTLAAAAATLDGEQAALLGLRLGPASPVVRADARAVLTAVRLAIGRSPAVAAAAARARGEPAVWPGDPS